LIKQSSALSAESQEGNSRLTDTDRDDVSVASNLDLMDGSVVGDSDTTEHHPVGLPSPLTKSVAGSGKRAEEAWEQELQQTLDSYELVDQQVDGELGDNDLELELGDDRKIA